MLKAAYTRENIQTFGVGVKMTDSEMQGFEMNFKRFIKDAVEAGYPLDNLYSLLVSQHDEYCVGRGKGMGHCT
jgi:hypothetical protein